MVVRLRRVLLSIVVLSPAVACSGSDSETRVGPSATGTASVATGEPSSTDVATTDDLATGVPVRVGPGEIQLVDPTVGLGNLAAAQVTLTITFDGERNGVAEQWSQTETSLTSRDPLLAQFSSARTGSGAYTLEYAAVDGVDYDVDADGRCESTTPEQDGLPDEFAPRRHPVEMLFGFAGGDKAGTETIGGMEAVHYTFDERALGLAAPTTAAGDVWVATTGGYIVRYSLVMDGPSPYVGKVSGRYTLDYELQPLAAPPAVEVPLACRAGLVDVPSPADATDLVSQQGMQTFTTSGTPADVQAWYEGQLVAAGWVAATAPLVEGDAVLLTFDRAGQRLVVSISSTGAATAVIVLVTASST